MDPIAVLKLVWRHRYVLLPVVIVTLVATIYVINFGPRVYQSSMSIAIVNPNVPTQIDKELDPRLAELNADNPYLRSSDSALIAQVVVARLNSPRTVRELEGAGLSPEYMVAPGSTGAGFVVNITGVGPTAESSLATTRALGAYLDQNLREVQKVDGADDRYLYTSIVITEPLEATEQFSSRLRSLIVVFLAGGLLAFAAISLARGISSARSKRRVSTTTIADTEDVELSAEGQEPPSSRSVSGAELPARNQSMQESVSRAASGQVSSAPVRTASGHAKDLDQ